MTTILSGQQQFVVYMEQTGKVWCHFVFFAVMRKRKLRDHLEYLRWILMLNVFPYFVWLADRKGIFVTKSFATGLQQSFRLTITVWMQHFAIFTERLFFFQTRVKGNKPL